MQTNTVIHLLQNLVITHFLLQHHKVVNQFNVFKKY